MSDSHDAAGAVRSSQIHDLKNRLTVIKGLAQLLARQVGRADWQRDRIVERVNSLQEEIGKLEQMIENLRDQRHSIDESTRAADGRQSTPDD